MAATTVAEGTDQKAAEALGNASRSSWPVLRAVSDLRVWTGRRQPGSASASTPRTAERGLRELLATAKLRFTRKWH